MANRTAATPDLLDAVAAYAREQPTTFSLLIPDSPSPAHADSTLELAIPLLWRAACGPVQGLVTGAADPFEAVRDELAGSGYDREAGARHRAFRPPASADDRRTFSQR